jgi:Big-like domain-containing protein
VNRSAGLWSLLFIMGCSGLDEGAGGVVGLQIQLPALRTVEVGESVQLSAIALDKDGQPVSADVAWRAADPTLTVDATGLITGVAAGTGRVQAFVGSLSSELASFNVVTRPDTLLIVGDSVLTVAPTATASAPLTAQVQTFSPPGTAVPSWPVIFTITSPPDLGGPHTVELPGAVLTDTLATGIDGAVSTVTLNRVAGIAQPDTAIVEIRSSHTRGEPVSGSGQRFIVIFQQ